MATTTETKTVQRATAKSLNMPISTKHCIELARNIRYKTTKTAKRFLEGVVGLETAVPFRKFRRDMGHKSGKWLQGDSRKKQRKKYYN